MSPHGQVVHLHNHSEHSCLDGLSRLRGMCQIAAEQGQDAIALTDHGTLGGAWKFAKAAKEVGIKPIQGCELYLSLGAREERNEEIEPRDDEGDTDADDDSHGKTTGGGDTKTRRYQHLTVLASSTQGWDSLVRIQSAAHASFWYKPRADFDLLARHSDGLIVLTGCLGGPVASKLKRGDYEGARANLGRLIEAVGKDNVYVEVMDHGIAAERKVTGGLVDLAREFWGPADYEKRVVATNDAHYPRDADAAAHDAWLAVGVGRKLDDTNRFAFKGTGYFIRSAEQMRGIFDDGNGTGKAVDTTLDIAERCSGDVLPASELRLPQFPTPQGFTGDAAAYLKHQVRAGAQRRYGAPLPQPVRDRLNFEFTIISDMGLADYFLIVADIIDASRKHGVRVGPGRGSSAGSVTSYCLEIVNVDPLAHGLLFERFLDPARVGMPDVDIDFDTVGRDWAINYAVTKYGADRVARIGTFGMARSRQAIKNAARVLDHVPIGNELSKLVPIVGDGKPMDFDQLDDEDNGSSTAFRAKVAASEEAKAVIELARSFEGVVAQEGIHACGVVIADATFDGLVPLRWDHRKGAEADTAVTAWDGKDMDDAQFLKLDFLGLRNLDVISEAVRLIEATTGEVIDADNPPTDPTDERVRTTWAGIRAGRTAGLFQLDGSGMTKLCEQIAPESVADLSAIIALYRPGPLGAKMDVHYVARKRGEEDVDYAIYTADPAEQAVIASVLNDTYGTCVAEGQRVYSATRGLMTPIEDIAVGELVQGVNDEGRHVLAPVTAHNDNGTRPTIKVLFSSGQSLRLTSDHRVLTTRGWVQAGDLTNMDSVAAPWNLLPDDTTACTSSDRREIDSARLLGFLLGDGSITVGSDVYFINSDADLRNAVAAAGLRAFPDSSVAHYPSCKGVGRVRFTGGFRGGVGGSPEGAMLAWLRELGLKTARDVRPRGGTHSRDKFIPTRYLRRNDEVAQALLGALWDCDGRVGNSNNGSPNVAYKTISAQLAEDVRFLLLRFGITSTLTPNHYTNPTGRKETAYNIGVHQTKRFCEVVVPFMASRYKIDASRLLRAPRYRCQSGSYVPATQIALLPSRIDTSWRGFCRENNLSRSVFRKAFVGAETVSVLAALSGDSEMMRLVGSQWQRVMSVEPQEATRVYDITVEGVHNFVAEGVIVHNCVYQEELMQLGELVAGFGPAEKNRLRKAFSKKIRAEMEAMRSSFVDGAQAELRDEHGAVAKMAFAVSTAEKLWETFDASAEYIFNKCLTGDTVVPTGGAKSWHLGELYRKLTTIDTPGPVCGWCAKVPSAVRGLCPDCYSWHQDFHSADKGFTLLSYDAADGRVRPKRVRDVHHNGVRDVWRIETGEGHVIRATAAHRFLVPLGWARVEELAVGAHIAVDAGHERAGAAHVVAFDEIVSITADGCADTYDVEMDDVGHNFVANGIVSHNSHSVAYGQTAYITAYLKANWPSQYGAALLAVTSQDDKRQGTLNALREEGVAVAPPSLRLGGISTLSTEDGTVRLGMREIKGVGDAARWIVAERDTGGPFESVRDLLRRVKVPATPGGPLVNNLGIGAVDGLIEAGALDEYGPRLGMKMALRAERDSDNVEVPDMEWGSLERAARERDRLGLVLSAHPLVTLKDQVKIWRPPGMEGKTRPMSNVPVPVQKIGAVDGAEILTLGVLASWAERSYSRGRMANIVLEGSTSAVECVLWDEQLLELKADGDLPVVGSILALRGKVTVTTVDTGDEDGGSEERRQVTARRVWKVTLDDDARLAMPAASAHVPLRRITAIGVTPAAPATFPTTATSPPSEVPTEPTDTHRSSPAAAENPEPEDTGREVVRLTLLLDKTDDAATQLSTADWEHVREQLFPTYPWRLLESRIAETPGGTDLEVFATPDGRLELLITVCDEPVSGDNLVITSQSVSG